MRKILLLFILLVGKELGSIPDVKILDIRYWTAPDHTRIVLDLSSPTKYRVLKTPDPKEIKIELPKVRSLFKKERIGIKDGLVKEVRLKEEGFSLRVLVELEVPASFKIFSLRKYLHKPDRIVIDILKPGKREREKALEEKVEKLKKKGLKIVVIDPGHGGEDAGAIGRILGIKEKDVVFDISKRTAKILNTIEGIKAFLTRKGDYFIPLRKRIEIARKYKADAFVSIHTNANRSKWERGSSVYVLSLQGATDEASRLLAEKENAADLIGGVEEVFEDDTLAKIFLDLTQTATLNQSLVLANRCMYQISRVGKTENDGVKRAGFVVLKTVNIPAILVETAFISNPQEERLLSSSQFRKALAKAISQGILNFLGFEEKLTECKTSRYHIVKKGETLWSISQKYNVSVSLLKKVNGFSHSDIIVVGQKLLIPQEK